MLLSIGVYAITAQPPIIVSEATVEHHGKGDNERGVKRNIFKPTGLLDRKIEKPILVQDAEVVLQKFADSNNVVEKEIISMSAAEVTFEISALMHKHYRTQEEEAMLLILIAANL